MISTDITRRTLNQAPAFRPAVSWSKAETVGLDWDKIGRSSVTKALRFLGLEMARSVAAVLQLRYDSVALGDSHGNVIEGA
jgi:hypothetical protein